jgi:hypothetical protein
MGNITRRPTTKNADDFINSAPDAATARQAAAPAKTNRKAGNQVVISVAMPPELPAKLDDSAGASSISRAAFIKQALARAVVAEGN